MLEDQFDEYNLSNIEFPQSSIVLFFKRRKKLVAVGFLVCLFVFVPTHASKSAEIIAPKIIKYIKKTDTESVTWTKYFHQKIGHLSNTIGKNPFTTVLTTTVVSAAICTGLLYNSFKDLKIEDTIEKICRLKSYDDFLGFRINNFTFFASNLVTSDLPEVFKSGEAIDPQMIFCTYKGVQENNKSLLLLIKPLIPRKQAFLKVLDHCADSKDEFFSCLSTLGILSGELL